MVVYLETDVWWNWLTIEVVEGLEVWRICAFFLVVLGALLIGRLARLMLDRAAGRASKKKRDVIAVAYRSLGRGLVPIALAIGVSCAFALLVLAPRLQSLVDTVIRVLNATAIGYAVYCFVDIVDHYLLGFASRTQSKVDDMLAPLVGKSVRITILVVVILQIAQSLSDKPITSVIAGLGVGGLAIALAAQDTLKNFFGSLVIVGDKPFEIGDRIIVDGHDGPVESVGFRSTRIRTLDGHVVTVPNSEIVNKTVLNVGKRPYIKRVMNVTITYDTPPEKVRRACDIIKEILENHEGMDAEFPPRVFFNEFNDWSLNILVLYWFHPPEYWDFLAFSERTNMKILERFNEEGIEFAFPSQTLYMANGEVFRNRP